MRSSIGLLLLFAFAPYVVWAGCDDDGNSATAAAAAAAAADEYYDDDEDTVTAAAAAAAAAAEDYDDDEDAAAAAAAAAAATGDEAAAAAAAAAAASNGAAAAAAATATSSSQYPGQGVYCSCNRDYKPVCGTDGNTYSNECILRCISIENQRRGGRPIYVHRQGVCPPITCYCSKIYSPVCGTNNQTYINEDYLDCENSFRIRNGLPPINIAYRGVCTAPTCICPRSVIPVCGTNGKTYRNICTLQCYSRANQAKGLPPIYVKEEGACKKETCICTQELNEICASDDNTYLNDCVFECQNRRRDQLGQPPLTMQYRGKCIKCQCFDMYLPVCANNGVTFRNKCWFACENEKRIKANLKPLFIRWGGKCNCDCSKKWKPVCASNYKTFQNECAMDCENKKRVQDGLNPLYIMGNGPCYKCNCGYCGIKRNPVCGSDKQTYWNLCWLLCNADCRKRAHYPPLWKLWNGVC